MSPTTPVADSFRPSGFRRIAGACRAMLLTLWNLPFRKLRKQRARKRITQAGREIFRRFSERQSPFDRPPQVLLQYGCVIFSKDRPLQLAALLESLRELVRPVSDIRVIYAVSEVEYAHAYAELAASSLAQGVRFVREQMGGFRRQLLASLDEMTTDRIFFLVDDIVVLHPTDLRVFDPLDPARTIPSLRLGKNTTHCYTVGSEQPLPPLREENGLLVWRWQEGALDWHYPLSVDGHLFDRRLVRALCDLINFRSPNTFEDQLDKHFKELFLPLEGACYPVSRLVNIPCNRVQNEILNRCGELGAQELLRLWQTGQRIDIRSLREHPIHGAHQDLPLPLRPLTPVTAARP